LKPLELLVCGEESSIRDKALTSAQEIVKKMNENQIIKYLFPMINKLSNREWFTARSAAAALAPLAYDRVNDKYKQEIMTILEKLSNDTAPTVRRSVAKSLPTIAKNANANTLHQISELYKLFAKDDQDSIRIQVIPVSAVLAEYLSWDLKTTVIIPTIILLAGDRAWRVRWCLCHHFKEIFPFLIDSTGASGGQSIGIINNIASTYDNLLNDPEPEVRAAASSQLSAVGKFIQKSIIVTRIVPTIQRLVTDNSEFVRAIISAEINSIGPLLGKEDTVKLLLPLLLILFRDEASDVRLNVISKLEGIHSTIGIELLSKSLLPAITSLAQDQKWRVRLAVIELMPMIGKQLGADIFTDSLISTCIQWCNDKIYSIRKHAATNIKKLSQLFGEEWTTKQVIPKIEKLSQDSQHTQRMTALFVFSILLENSNNIQLHKIIAPLAMKLANDPVANVRFTAAKTLIIPLKLFQTTNVSQNDPVRGEIVNCLKKLVGDNDRDVRFYANQVRG
jgi:serine/threonine-protein phosphatase 2A regulatory subunit A